MQSNIGDVFFQIGNAVRLDAERSQWIDLGIHPDVCLAQPDRCNLGGALSMWIKTGPGSFTGIVSSKENSERMRGFTVGSTFEHIA